MTVTYLKKSIVVLIAFCLSMPLLFLTTYLVRQIELVLRSQRMAKRYNNAILPEIDLLSL